ncbi:MAG: hypothetical protein AAFX85_20760, partial [Pseudomonadota bacterium]
MIVSHAQQFVFVHVGKAAGTSISRALAPYADPMPRDQVSRVLSKLGLVLRRDRLYWPIHASARYVRQRLGARRFADVHEDELLRVGDDHR